MSETQLDSAATDARQPDAETGEADEVSDYSEEADGFDAVGLSDDPAAPAEDDPAAPAEDELAAPAEDDSAAPAEDELAAPAEEPAEDDTDPPRTACSKSSCGNCACCPVTGMWCTPTPVTRTG